MEPSYYYHTDFTEPAEPVTLDYSQSYTPYVTVPGSPVDFEFDESMCVVCQRAPCTCPAEQPRFFDDCPVYP
ncbi:hypothetical protein IWQ60_010302 [Tieghemiomyces parasiticus]|uniref:Uncharacterized protein n=1 Tax=Tieghemiomyces parasiticus TaxID=78921 RepID=A0A9W7ZJK1_9FUNG|nr:hypothetical protein IWQ60_010521 [Tieghemiomyces parasiticus]KAJ1911106.1 hypothetical protein IWQ60_010302 [Tieghemiomyces parasiticus]